MKNYPTTYDTKSTEVAIALLKKARALKLALLFSLLALSSCGLKIGPVELPDGFAFSVGVNNVNQVLDKKGLSAEKLENNKLNKY